MYELWYNYLKQKYCEKAKLSYVDTGSSIGYIKTDDFHKDVAENGENRFDTSNHDLDRLRIA